MKMNLMKNGKPSPPELDVLGSPEHAPVLEIVSPSNIITAATLWRVLDSRPIRTRILVMCFTSFDSFLPPPWRWHWASYQVHQRRKSLCLKPYSTHAKEDELVAHQGIWFQYHLRSKLWGFEKVQHHRSSHSLESTKNCAR